MYETAVDDPEGAAGGGGPDEGEIQNLDTKIYDGASKDAGSYYEKILNMPMPAVKYGAMRNDDVKQDDDAEAEAARPESKQAALAQAHGGAELPEGVPPQPLTLSPRSPKPDDPGYQAFVAARQALKGTLEKPTPT